jgi:hypothetical protein
MRAGHDLDDGALAASILAEKVISLSEIEREVDAAQCMHAAEPLVDVAQFEKRSGARPFSVLLFIVVDTLIPLPQRIIALARNGSAVGWLAALKH